MWIRTNNLKVLQRTIYQLDFLEKGSSSLGWDGYNYGRILHQYVKENGKLHIVYSFTPLIQIILPSMQVSGTAKPLFASRLLEEPHLIAERQHDIKWSTLSLYKGGADTANSFFILQWNFTHPYEQTVFHLVYSIWPWPFILTLYNAITLEIVQWHGVAPTGEVSPITQCIAHQDVEL